MSSLDSLMPTLQSARERHESEVAKKQRREAKAAYERSGDAWLDISRKGEAPWINAKSAQGYSQGHKADLTGLLELAAKKRSGWTIEAMPADKAKLPRMIVTAMKEACDPKSGMYRDGTYSPLPASQQRKFGYDRNQALRFAITGMYVLDLTENKTLLNMLRKGIADPYVQQHLKQNDVDIISAMAETGIIDERHAKQGLCTSTAYAGITEKLLTPKQRRTLSEFDIGEREARALMDRDLYGSWSSIETRTEKEKGWFKRSKQVEYAHNHGMQCSDALLVARQVLSRERITISDRDKGKLYASGAIILEMMADGAKYSYPQTAASIAIAELYLSGKLNTPESAKRIENAAKARPDIIPALQASLASYAAK